MNFNKYKLILGHVMLTPIRPLLREDSTPDYYRTYAEALERHERDMDAYRAWYQGVEKQQVELLQMFREDAFRELGLADHPKAELIWKHALRRSRTLDYESIYDILEDIAAILSDAPKNEWAINIHSTQKP